MSENKNKTIHGVSEGDKVRVTDVAGSKAIDQDSDEWSGNMELGKDEIIPQVRKGVIFEVRSISRSIRTEKVLVNLYPVEGQDIPTWKSVHAETYESWPNGVSKGMKFDADGHTTHYSDKFFDVEVVN